MDIAAKGNHINDLALWKALFARSAWAMATKMRLEKHNQRTRSSY